MREAHVGLLRLSKRSCVQMKVELNRVLLIIHSENRSLLLSLVHFE